MNERERWPDDVKRAKDEMDYHATVGNHGWCVLALADGKPLDHIAYETWSDAVKAAKWDRDRYIFVQIQPDGATYKETAAFLKYARTLYDMGYRIPSPDWEAGPLASSMPYNPLDRFRMAKQLASGTPIPGIHSNLPAAYRKG